MVSARSLRFLESSETITAACFLPSPKSARQISPRLGFKALAAVNVDSRGCAGERLAQHTFFFKSFGREVLEIGGGSGGKPLAVLQPSRPADSKIDGLGEILRPPGFNQR